MIDQQSLVYIKYLELVTGIVIILPTIFEIVYTTPLHKALLSNTVKLNAILTMSYEGQRIFRKSLLKAKMGHGTRFIVSSAFEPIHSGCMLMFETQNRKASG